MKKVFHKKLIRDKIPQVIEASGDKYELRIMGKREFERELKKKLVEEASELLEVKRKDLLNEMVDVLELLKTIAEFYNIDFKLVEEKQVKKRKERGGFKKRLFLIWSSRRPGE
ncbi:nucleoside triphosphate pyrophosphohydrolase [Patescibacteria group bacterium]|nr:nucleoside triphosphate pyrophosphohydrolase [Patescibacteria group bacterium]